MTQAIELAKNLEWEPELYEDQFFTPSTRQIKVKGVKTGSRTIYRNSYNKVEPISIVGPNYKLITNEKLHNVIIAGVMQYSEIPVIVSDGEHEYNLHHEKEVEEF